MEIPQHTQQADEDEIQIQQELEQPMTQQDDKDNDSMEETTEVIIVKEEQDREESERITHKIVEATEKSHKTEQRRNQRKAQKERKAAKLLYLSNANADKNKENNTSLAKLLGQLDGDVRRRHKQEARHTMEKIIQREIPRNGSSHGIHESKRRTNDESPIHNRQVEEVEHDNIKHENCVGLPRRPATKNDADSENRARDANNMKNNHQPNTNRSKQPPGPHRQTRRNNRDKIRQSSIR